jgi:hypothetical protein
VALADMKGVRRRPFAVLVTASLAVAACDQRTTAQRVAGCYEFVWAGDSTPVSRHLSPDSVELTQVVVNPEQSVWAVKSGGMAPETIIVSSHQPQPHGGWRWYSYFNEKYWEVTSPDSFRIVLQAWFGIMEIHAEAAGRHATGRGVFRFTDGRENDPARFSATRYPCPSR